jgi:hypothetical protein
MHHPANDRCVPKAASHDANLSVSFGGNRRQKKTHRNGWVNKPCNWPKGINDLSGDYLTSRDAVHELKTCFN